MNNLCDKCGTKCTTLRKFKDEDGYVFLCWKCFEKKAHIIYCSPKKFNEPLCEKMNATFMLTHNQKGKYIKRIKKLRIKKSEYHRSLVVSDIDR